MMLYHVPDLHKGLSEVKRVLAEDVLDYVYSLTNVSPVAKMGRGKVKEILEKEMNDGVLHIPKEYQLRYAIIRKSIPCIYSALKD